MAPEIFIIQNHSSGKRAEESNNVQESKADQVNHTQPIHNLLEANKLIQHAHYLFNRVTNL